jgi:DNA repair exonuclease SbcCD nuclease subunit
MIRFIHTADWQIGKLFSAMGEVGAQLRAARLDAIDKMAAHAKANSITHVLVAGDLYDGENLARATWMGPLERMRAASGITWWVIAGNHDPHRAGGLWEALLTYGLPDNVRFCGEQTPIEIAPGAWLLPASLSGRHTSLDTTRWMDEAETSVGAIRIGLAHGSIKDFGQRQTSPNVIDPARISAAKLDWLALGDWHGKMLVGARCAYPGTPEPDAFRDARTGTALDVTIAGPGAVPVVTTIETGTYDWIEMTLSLAGTGSVNDLVALVVQQTTSKSVVRLKLSGALGPADWPLLDHALDQIRARICYLDDQRDGIELALDEATLAGIRLDGLLGQVAEQLMMQASAGGADPTVARDALVELYRRAGAI